ncbi:MAG: FAD-dependent oxidoreductase [Erysipelotrichaceae bacterium]|nr:FAD-dependent oxidoreductase [Erysipelotrichaceae bacterium]
MKKLLILALSLLMAASMVACGSDVKEETFEASAAGFGGEVTVKVTFKGEDITKVEVSGPNETSGIGSNAVEQLPAKIEEADGADVDVVSGATITSEAIKSAVRKAIKLKNGETDSGISYNAGTYTATVKGHRGDITGEVTFDESSIVSINITSCGDTYGVGYGMDTTPTEALTAKIVETQSLGVDVITGATVSSNAIIALVADAAAQAGADVDALKAVAVAKDEAKDVTYDVDVVVVGAGVAGLSAAIAASENGANVLLVEKQGIAGGATTYSGGKLLAAGTDVQAATGITDDADTMFAYLKSVGGDYLNDEKVKAFTDNALDVYNWMVDLGVMIHDVEPIHSSLPTWRVHNTTNLDGRAGGGMTDGFGGNIIVPLYDHWSSLKGETLYNTTVNEIVMKDGKAAGVKAVKADGSVVTVNATDVIIATGGYAQNKELVSTYGQAFPYYVTSVPKGNMGDGIAMVEAAGGMVSFDNPAVQTVFLNFYSGVGINEEPGLIVNHLGERVANEYSYQYHVSDSLAASGATSAWYICTSNEPTPYVQYAMSLDSTLKASSVEELAALMGVEAETLKATVDRYNTLAANGNDEDFGKPAQYMYPVEGETYFALQMLPNVTVTFNGIVTDANAQVLDTNGNPIEGLYAAGETAFPGLFGTEYPCCGMAISGGAYYGLVAGEHAALN